MRSFRSNAVTLAAALLFATFPTHPVGAQTVVESVASELSFRDIGPAIIGGRVSDLEGLESNPAEFYVGLATGGVWHTDNQGVSWTPLFDDQPCSSIGDVTVYQDNPNIVWVGTGEPQNRQSSPYGCGVFRTTDGGKTWMNLGLEETRHIGRIAVHPRDPDVAYVAAVGHLWGPNPERGVYKTTDGGESWDRVLYIDDDTGAIDLVMDPADPNTIFVAMYQRRRTVFGFSASGGGSGIYRTNDGGRSWVELTEGLPEGEKGRIGLDVFRGDGNLVYATVEAGGDDQGLYRSFDRGDSWEKVSDRNPRPMYFSMVRIDPNDASRIYLGGVSFSASDDGGRTWWQGDAADGIHVDHHALWIDPGNSRHLILGNDGGIATSWDGSRTWRHHNNLPIGQFYEIGVDDSDPYIVCGGLQDNSSWCAPNETTTGYGLKNRDWIDVWGGDGFYNEFDPFDNGVLYSESQGGNSGRVDLATGQTWRMRPASRAGADDPALDYEFNWNAPIVPSVHTEGTVYVGGTHLMRSRDRGLTWDEASPDLTRMIDRDTLEIMGAVVTDETLSRNDGLGSYGNISAVEESPRSAQVLWVGTDDGNLQVTRDGGANWTNVVDRVPGLPGRSYVSRIDASHSVDGRAYVAFDRHFDDDYRPYVYVTEDFGATWTSLANGLPDWSINVVREHPRTPDLLFVGNEIGVFTSVDRGATWHRMDGLPTVPVDDLEIQARENDLIVGTHGRSIWIVDDLAPLEEMAGRNFAGTDAFVFSVADATQRFRLGGWPFWGDLYEAPRPADGAVIRYWLGGDVEDATLTVTSAMGETIRELEAKSGRGFHEVVWDLREKAPVEVERQQGGGGFGGGPPQGPLVLPGTYLVQLDAGDQVAEQEVLVKLDPRVEADMVALRDRQSVARSGAAIAGTVTNAQRAIRRLRDQIGDAVEMLEAAEAEEALVERAKLLDEELDSLSDRIERAGPGRAAFGIESNAGSPTADTRWALDRAWEMVPPLVEEVNRYIEDRVPALYRSMNDAGVYPDTGEPVVVPPRPGGD